MTNTVSAAVKAGAATTLKRLLADGCDPDEQASAGWRPLHHAAFHKNDEAIALLLDAGAEVDTCKDDGDTALILAAFKHPGPDDHDDHKHYEKCVQLLVNAGADVHAKNKVRQPSVGPSHIAL